MFIFLCRNIVEGKSVDGIRPVEENEADKSDNDEGRGTTIADLRLALEQRGEREIRS